MTDFKVIMSELEARHEELLTRKNTPDEHYNGIYTRYRNPILTARHTPLHWRYDFDPQSNPFCMERIGMNAVMNAGAIKWHDKYIVVARVEGADRKSFFAVAESPNGIDNFRFWDYPIRMPEYGEPATNIYDMRLTAHEDGWIYGVFCIERKDPDAAPGDLSSAVAAAGIARTRNLVDWERLPDLVSKSQQRNVVLHPEFVDGKYAFYTRPQDGFIDTGNGQGIGWALVDDIARAEIVGETIINRRYYHTIKEGKNGEGPHPIKTPHGWLHLAHGVRSCAAGLRYVLHDRTRAPVGAAGRTGRPVHGSGGRRTHRRRVERPLLQRLDRRPRRPRLHLLCFKRHAPARGHLHRRTAGRLLPAHPRRRPHDRPQRRTTLETHR